MASKIRQRYSYLAGRIRRQIAKLTERMPDAVSLERYSASEFPKLRDMKIPPTDRALKAAVRKAEKLLASGELTLRHQKRSVASAIKTLNDRGYNYLNQGNFKYFFDFLDDARSRGLASIYGYQYLLDTFNRAKKRGLTEEQILGNMQYWEEQTNKQKAIAMKKGIPLEEIKGKRLYLRKDRKYDSSKDSFQRSKKSKRRK